MQISLAEEEARLDSILADIKEIENIHNKKIDLPEFPASDSEMVSQEDELQKAEPEKLEETPDPKSEVKQINPDKVMTPDEIAKLLESL